MAQDWRKLKWSTWRPFNRQEVLDRAPSDGGVYLLRADQIGPLAYVGTSRSIVNRLRMHLSRFSKIKGKAEFEKLDLEFSFHLVAAELTRRVLELNIINEHRQEFGFGPIFNNAVEEPENANVDGSTMPEPILAKKIGLLGPDGRPLSAEHNRATLAKVKFVERHLMK